jgi:glycerate 2-kinase
MKIVIAPQGFKGNLTARQVSLAIETGVKRASPDAETVIKPMADGGDGTAQALVDATGGRLISARVTGPLGEPVTAQWGLLGDKTTAIIEMASASGLALVPSGKLNPLIATTYGTGELIKHALDYGCRKLIVGIGGSATNDGGAGMAQALGVNLHDSANSELPFGGGALSRLSRVSIGNLDARLAESEVLLACDVSNPLCGPAGASCIYGPQKGATPEMVDALDSALARFADIIRRDLGVDFRDYPGAGAAGGLGMGLLVFLKAKMVSGIEIVIKLTGLGEELRGAGLVFTAEGRIDGQTAFGKTPVGVARLARESGIPVICLAGEVQDGYQAVFKEGINAVFSIAPGPVSLKQSMDRAENLIAATAENALRLFISAAKN